METLTGTRNAESETTTNTTRRTRLALDAMCADLDALIAIIESLPSGGA